MEYSARRGAITGAVLWRVRADGEQRVLPDGALDLMWADGRLVIAGPDTTAMVVNAKPGAQTFGLRFPLGVAPLLLRVSAADLVNQRVDLRDLVGLSRSFDTSARDAASVSVLLEQVYLHLWRRAEPDRTTVRLAAFLDRKVRLGAPVRSLGSETGIAERSLHRKSHLLFGFGLKTLSGIRRFQRACELVRAGTELSEAAAQAGYADQAHMTREVTRFAGTTPTRLAQVGTRTRST